MKYYIGGIAGVWAFAAFTVLLMLGVRALFDVAPHLMVVVGISLITSIGVFFGYVWRSDEGEAE